MTYLENFLLESNAIEGVYGPERLSDAMDAWYWLSNREINESNILQAHKFLMFRDRERLDINYGNWRRWDVRVGDYHAPSHLVVRELMDRWIKKYWYVPLDWKQAHIEFENVHPCIDGNGRLGRILMNIHRVRMGKQILIIEAKHRSHYYQWFKDARKT